MRKKAQSGLLMIYALLMSYPCLANDYNEDYNDGHSEAQRERVQSADDCDDLSGPRDSAFAEGCNSWVEERQMRLREGLAIPGERDEPIPHGADE